MTSCPRQKIVQSAPTTAVPSGDSTNPDGEALFPAGKVSDDAYPAGLLLFEGRLSHPGDMRLPQVGLEIP